MSYFVPISLIVNLEVVKLIQGKMLERDDRMLSAMTNTLPKVNNSTVNESLGRVNYIFSDKTGTLTCNVMNFKKLCIQGRSFGGKRA